MNSQSCRLNKSGDNHSIDHFMFVHEVFMKLT